VVVIYSCPGCRFSAIFLDLEYSKFICYKKGDAKGAGVNISITIDIIKNAQKQRNKAPNLSPVLEVVTQNDC
jgi:hypothetical protein